MNQPIYKLAITLSMLLGQLLNAQSYKIELIKDIDTTFAKSGVSQTSPLFSVGNKVYFAGSTAGTGMELWVTDGTGFGTSLVKDVRPGTLSSTPTIYQELNGNIFFNVNTGASSRELLRTDGTEAGTFRIKSIDVDRFFAPKLNSVMFKNKLWLTTSKTTGSGDLYFSDGTENGTKLFTGSDTTKPLITNATILAVTDSVIYLKGEVTTSGLGVELIKTDGTLQGTKVIKDFVEGSMGSESNDLGFHNNPKEIYVIGFSEKLNPPVKIGTELWKSNGNAEGTGVIKNLNLPNGWNQVPVYNYTMFTYNGRMYYNNFNENNYNYFNLWSTNGTEQGTLKFEADSGFISLGFTEYNGEMYYLNGAQSHDLWRTDGISKRFLYKTGSFREKNAVVKTFIHNDKLLYFYTDLTNDKNFSDLIEISKDTAKSLVNDFAGFENIYDIEKFGSSFILKLKTTDKGIELYRLTFTTSTTELQAVQSLTLFPNPSTGDITIDSPEHGVLKFYNLMGQQVFQQQIAQIGKILVSPNLPSGSYEVVLNATSKQYQNKLIITK